MNTPRRERGSLVGAKRVGLTFEEEADERLTALARAAGTSRSAVAQWLIEQATTDANGAPKGWRHAHRLESELPIERAS